MNDPSSKGSVSFHNTFIALDLYPVLIKLSLKEYLNLSHGRKNVKTVFPLKKARSQMNNAL